jgi:multidrug resistance efflux pump
MAQKPVRWVVRGGGPWWLRWPLRIAGLSGLLALGFIRYNYEIAGECRLIPVAQYGIRSQLTDELVQLQVTEGDYVEAGAVIATLSARTTGSDYRMTQHDLEMAQAELDLLRNGPRKEDIAIASDTVEIRRNQLKLADIELNRNTSLFNRGMVSVAQMQKVREDRDNAELNLLAARQELSKLQVGYREEAIRAADAKVKRLEEKLKLDEQMLKLTELKTPIAGRVVTPHLDGRRGLQTKGGDLVAVIQDTSSLWVEVAADECAAVDVRKGMPAKVRLYGLDSGRLLTGHVRGIALNAESDSKFAVDAIRSDREVDNEQFSTSGNKNDQRVRVYVEFDEYPPGLVPGMDGYCRIISNRNDLFWRALARPIVRFLRTEVWYWLP